MRRSGRLPLESLAPFLLEVQRPFVPAEPGETPEATAASVAYRLPCFEGKKPLDWCEVFGNAHPVEIEIGFGKGLFLLNASEANPETNFFGIEKERQYTLFTAARVGKRGRENVRLACADARWFLKEWIADTSVRTVHVYFPDPWWKKRHHKRRLFNEDFAAQIVRVLEPGGELSFATDVPEYFAETMPMLRAMPELTELPPPAQVQAQHDMDYLTNFERKFRKQAKPILRARMRKTQRSAG